MTRAEKRKQIARLIAENPGASDRTIGKLAGVDGKTVAAVRKSSAEIETPHPAEIPQAKTPQCGKEARKFRIEFRSAENGAEIETPHADLVDLAKAPVDEIAAAIKALPEERRAALVQALLASEPKPPGHWKFRTSADQRAELMALCAGGMSVSEAAIKTGINYRTAVSQIKKAGSISTGVQSHAIQKWE